VPILDTVTKVVLVDDSAPFRGLLRLYLENLPDVAVVGEAANGVEALEEVARTTPDLVLMDVRMPTMDGLEATRRLRAAGVPVRVLLMSLHRDAVPESLVTETGADGLLDKADLGHGRLREAVLGASGAKAKST
jgi:DNA-binding NarL/FixJ family response regulator